MLANLSVSLKRQIVAVFEVPCFMAMNTWHLKLLTCKDFNVTSALSYAAYVVQRSATEKHLMLLLDKLGIKSLETVL